ncbi:sensor histidine kinase, partial [Pseudomonas syringae]|nr:sensor histidine kinase [Pseudomonas syringae]
MINLAGRRGSLHRLVSAIILGFGLLMTIGLTTLGFMSQDLIDHPIWKDLLETATANTLEDDVLPGAQKDARIQVWKLSGSTPAAGMPPPFASLAPGYYSEGDLDRQDAVNGDRDYAVLVTPLGKERLIAAIDISDLEQEQNFIALVGAMFLVLNLILIIAVIAWLYVRLHLPVQGLALG